MVRRAWQPVARQEAESAYLTHTHALNTQEPEIGNCKCGRTINSQNLTTATYLPQQGYMFHSPPNRRQRRDRVFKRMCLIQTAPVGYKSQGFLASQPVPISETQASERSCLKRWGLGWRNTGPWKWLSGLKDLPSSLTTQV